MKCFLIFLLLLPFVVDAQKDIPGGTSIPTTAGLIMDARDVTGKPIPTSTKLDIEGTPMLSYDFTNGAVKFKNEEKTYNLMLNLSLIDNQLYFKKDNETMRFVNAVEAFAISVKMEDSVKGMNFKSGYPNIGNNSEQTFYQILADGSKVQLLRYIYKIIQEKSNYGGSHEREYVEKERLYIFDKTSKTIAVITPSANALKKALPQYAAAIEKFVSQNKIKNVADVQLVLNFINNG